jgi:hypothetical protein
MAYKNKHALYFWNVYRTGGKNKTLSMIKKRLINL